jgi:hypothetical protein
VRRVTRAALWLLSAHFLLGLAHVAVLPPWEGFDETAHYSYLQQLVDQREVPRLNEARVSTDVERYARVAPLPYSLQGAGGITYEAFFAGSAGARASAQAVVQGRPDEPRRYAPGPAPNWQAQHPPLYYLVLSPMYALTRDLSWRSHLFLLRFTSYLFAWVALLIGMYACLTAPPSILNGSRVSWEWGAVGIGLWPLVLPSWFPDTARLGNDSLCALILAGVWWLTLRAPATGLSLPRAAALGGLLGAGCLTKIFFVPITIACLCFWLVRVGTLGGKRALLSALPKLGMTLLLTGALAGSWYYRNWEEHGVPFGSLELIELRRTDGLLSGLARHDALSRLPMTPVVLATTLISPATWSLAGAPTAAIVPLGFTVILACAAYWRVLRGARCSQIVWFPAWLAGLLVTALGWHALVRMAVSGNYLPAHYVNLLAPALGAAVGMGLGTSWHHGLFRRAWTAGVAYALVFGGAIFWAQTLLFSGLAVSYGAGSRKYSAAAVLARMSELPDALDRLTLLAYPWAGAAAWLAGNVLVLVGLAHARRTPAAANEGRPPGGPGGAVTDGAWALTSLFRWKRPSKGRLEC